MTTAATQTLREIIHPISGQPADYDPLLKLVGNAKLVLIGEASHGTHEFYRERAVLTRRLIQELGFNAVAVEADWPDAYRVNRYVRGKGADRSAEEALRDFERFPQWMWRNADVLDMVGWLQQFNESLPARSERVGFYGLDLYSLHRSMNAVVDYLESVDPAGAERARSRYGCFDLYPNADDYGVAAGLRLARSCEDAVVQQLVDFRSNLTQYVSRNGSIPPDEWFFADQNALLVRDAEAYYRAMVNGRISSWNLRDRHMADTLDALLNHLSRAGNRARIVVWAHNSHVGDAGATQMSAQGEWNLGELSRARHHNDCVLIGFSTYTGTVTAASNWGSPAEKKRVRPGLAESYEAMFYQVDCPAFFITLRDKAGVPELVEPRLQRAIGVVYKPETERWSHYLVASVARQFDAIIHFDETRAVEPLERTAAWSKGELPDTYPTGF